MLLLTTIAWRLGHIIVGVLGMRVASHSGGPPFDYATHRYPGDAATALAQLDSVYGGWMAGVRGLGARLISAISADATGLAARYNEGMSGVLRGPFGLAWRLQRPVLAAWLAAFVFAFAAFGAGANGFGSIIGGSAELRRYLLEVGYQATLIDAYLSALMLIAGLAAAVYSTSAVLRLRTEETGNLAEPVLAAATGRIRWALSHISVAACGACLLLTAAGLSAGPAPTRQTAAGRLGRLRARRSVPAQQAPCPPAPGRSETARPQPEARSMHVRRAKHRGLT